MSCLHRALVIAAAALLVSFGTSASALTIDFELLVNGEEGDFIFVFSGVTVGVVADIPPPGNHLGLAAFDSDSGGPNASGGDPDLLVDQGMILILQNNNFPTQTTAGIYDTPNDDEQGGQFFFNFSVPSVLDSIDLIDINGGGMLTVVLTDSSAETRTYSVPDEWTGDIDQGDVGIQTLDLVTLANQVGVGPGNPVATASQTSGFDPNSVVQLTITFDGSAAVDNLEFIPEPVTALLLGLGLGALGVHRRRT